MKGKREIPGWVAGLSDQDAGLTPVKKRKENRQSLRLQCISKEDLARQ